MARAFQNATAGGDGGLRGSRLTSLESGLLICKMGMTPSPGCFPASEATKPTTCQAPLLTGRGSIRGCRTRCTLNWPAFLYRARRAAGQRERRRRYVMERLRGRSTGSESRGPGSPGSSALGSWMPLGMSQNVCLALLIFRGQRYLSNTGSCEVRGCW